MNFELKVKEIIIDSFILTGKIKDQNIINNLINTVRNTKDDKLSYKTNVKGHFTGFQCFIENKDFLDFLKIIQPSIKIIYKDNFVIQDAWGNLCKINEEVTEHDHSSINAFCGILYLTENGPGTYFKEYDLLVKEEIGKYILFHPILKHSVAKIKNDIERLTVAFNMCQVKEWDNSFNVKWINKNDI